MVRALTLRALTQSPEIDTVDALQEKLTAAGERYDFHRYLAQQAWDRTLRFFGKHLG